MLNFYIEIQHFSLFLFLPQNQNSNEQKVYILSDNRIYSQLLNLLKIQEIRLVPLPNMQTRLFFYIASAMVFPFRVDQMMCFVANNTRAANKHTGHPHPQGHGASTSHLITGYAIDMKPLTR